MVAGISLMCLALLSATPEVTRSDVDPTTQVGLRVIESAGAVSTFDAGIALEQRFAAAWSIGAAVTLSFTRANLTGGGTLTLSGVLEPFIRRYLGATSLEGAFVGVDLPVRLSHTVMGVEDATSAGAGLGLDLGYSLHLGRGITVQGFIGPVVGVAWARSTLLGVLPSLGIAGSASGAGDPPTSQGFVWTGGLRAALFLGYAF
jgi:hypothetical protein